MDGVAIIDKAEGWTSHDVVAKFRGIAKTRRVGHLGTLDPMATGVLPLAVGQATRLARFYTRSEKSYEAGVRLGFATDTYDRTGVAVTKAVPVNVTREQFDAALVPFRGTLMQMPPQYSAKKVRGVVAYKAARVGVTVALAPVEVQIDELTVLSFDGQRADLRVRCSGGTYIRSLAHDLGTALGCGAHLDALRRLASGEFTMERAHRLEQWSPQHVVPMRDLLPHFPRFRADELTATHIRQGREFSAPGFTADHLCAEDSEGKLIAVCNRVTAERYHPSVVLTTDSEG